MLTSGTLSLKGEGKLQLQLEFFIGQVEGFHGEHVLCSAPPPFPCPLYTMVALEALCHACHISVILFLFIYNLFLRTTFWLYQNTFSPSIRTISLLLYLPLLLIQSFVINYQFSETFKSICLLCVYGNKFMFKPLVQNKYFPKSATVTPFAIILKSLNDTFLYVPWHIFYALLP